MIKQNLNENAASKEKKKVKPQKDLSDGDEPKSTRSDDFSSLSISPSILKENKILTTVNAKRSVTPRNGSKLASKCFISPDLTSSSTPIKATTPNVNSPMIDYNILEDDKLSI